MELANLIRTKSDPTLRRGEPLNILFASTEVAPFSKTGGLGDVAAALPGALAQRGHHVSVITPLYKHLDAEKMLLSRRLRKLEVPRQARSQRKLEATIWEGRLGYDVRIFFIDAPEYYGRDGLYGYDGGDFEDNVERFSFFSRAIVEFVRTMSVPVDIVHLNDWHTGLAPVYAQQYYADDFEDRSFVFTIHNLAYQGQFPAEEFKATGLPKSLLKESALGQGDGFNLLKAGLRYSDFLTTVSPTYSEEIKTEEEGFGLDEVLREREDVFSGILNGAAYDVWSPDIDPVIAVRYDVDSLNGKRRNKAELQHAFKLPVRPMLPLLGFIGRLAEQKGLDILLPALRELLEGFTSEREGFQVVLLGEGDKKYQDQLLELAKDFPKRVAAHIGYGEDHAHKIQAGSDILLVPSRFEPCGLSQMYALKYGTLPLVHATGGLVDTVFDAEDDSAEKSTGFVFEEYSSDALRDTIVRATQAYRKYRKWRPLMVNAMDQDFSWNTSATEYERLYQISLGIDPDAFEDDDEDGDAQDTDSEE